MLRDPRAGWLLPSRDPVAIAETLENLLNERERIDELIESGGPREVFEALTDQDAFREGYLRLAGTEPERRTGSDDSSPLVSVIVPYYRLDAFVEETIESIFAQDYPNLEVIVVNDGSLRAEDIKLTELAGRYPIRVLTKANAGPGAARNSGIRQSAGKYVFPLDADNLVTPDFIRRCVEVLEHDPAVAYVTSWSQYIDERGNEHEGPGGRYHPIGNSLELVMDSNVAGDATAVIRRRIFDLGHWYSTDLTTYEDWQFYRELHDAGLYGRVIPEPLMLYRVRGDSLVRSVGLPRHERLLGEMNAHLIERRIEWEYETS
jgi:glycosyltransferase involved in cell wall biosynthesis